MSEDDILDLACVRVARRLGSTKHDVYAATCSRPGCSRETCVAVHREVAKIKHEEEERRLGACGGPTAPPVRGILPDDDTARLEYPMADGLLYYFPAALAEVARISKIGNDQHNPGLPLHWERGKSTDHENKILRHLAEAGTKDSRGVRHSARLAWRALALLQVELEKEEGAPLPRNARF